MTTIRREARPRRAGSLRSWLYGCAAGCLLVIAVITGCGTFGGNFHTVVPGRVYRCAQPSVPELEALIGERGIRTVINLRGCCASVDWYLDECRVTHGLNVAQEDISLSATRLPSTSELRRLVEVLDHCEYPVLIHCFRGADRTGLASAIVRLLQDDISVDEALDQLGIRYGHVRIGKTAYIDRFFELYADWLAEQKIEHTPDAFRRWATTAYCPGACRCKLDLLHAPGHVLRGKAAVFAVRATNISIKPWQLRPESNAGIHASLTLYDARDVQVAEARAGLFEAEVAPGASIDLNLVVPAIARPGRYRLLVDMVDEQQCSFFQTGSEPLEMELEVREQEIATGG